MLASGVAHGVRDGQANDVGDLDLGAVDGEAHGERGGEQSEGDEVETKDNALCDALGARFDGRGRLPLDADFHRRLSVSGSGWMKRRATSGAASLKRPSSDVMTLWTWTMGRSSRRVQWQET